MPTSVVYYNKLIITFSECILMNYFFCFCCIYITRCLFCFYVSLIFIILISFNFYVCFYFNNALRCVLMKTINNFETETVCWNLQAGTYWVDLPEAQFPSATPRLDVHKSVEIQVPNITKLLLAVLKMVHCLCKRKVKITIYFKCCKVKT